MRSDLPEAVGICLGASSIGLVLVAAQAHGPAILSAQSRPHGGDPSRALGEMLETVPGWRGMHPCVTGRKLRALINLPSISEPEAVELAAAHELRGEAAHAAVISAGGETFMVYGLDGRGLVGEIRSGNKCASGTGEFLAQQLGRMGLGVGDLIGMDHEVQPHPVSGRCSVFCKSDCTHALNKGASRQSVVAGLGRMMAGKCLELLHGIPARRVLLTGGCAANPYLARFLREKAGDVLIPESAPWFEALGAALHALAARPEPLGDGQLFTRRTPVFSMLPPLSESMDLVDFKEHARGRAEPGDQVIVGLDVGSTTTKGVVLRCRDKAVLAGEYLRTEGDPVGASRRVYESLARQLGAPVAVSGLGVTGSGRAIAALHAGATAAINEIVAHAAAAAHYDPKVDTIFEIGGQDAKYTFLSGGHPCDSAMNEACSAGTGSFLEESARESLGVDTLDIAERALSARATPNFNDQCAAFIGSDIKLASQENLPPDAILAGLVHSVCLNYVSRVKGSRPVGERVFMQGGVCYNRAVPAAMAMLTGKRIVVPPEPGLMGALGVALEVDSRMRRGLLQEGRFDLAELAAREARRREPFTCRGGKGGLPGCDRGCAIARIEVGGRVHPFGGVCNRFENLRQGKAPDTGALDYVQARQRRIYRDYALPSGVRPLVGLSRSYLVNTYFPLFAGFFTALGFDVLLPDRPDPEGVNRLGASLCYPAELAHCFMSALAGKRPDAVFLPHLRGVPSAGGQETSCTCVLLQGEPFYLAAAFPELRALGDRFLTPSLDFSRGFGGAEKAFIAMARSLGADSRTARKAFRSAAASQEQCLRDISRMGMEAMERLGDGEAGLCVALFGRSYNAFAAEANKAVPEKLATRGAMAVPCDMLPLERQGKDDFGMYWGQGRTIIAAARYAAPRPGLYGAYVTNFSCGPDSFLLGYFRDEMGAKPSLTLEMDSHTADAGLETRLEAFLDIADNHRRAARKSRDAAPSRVRTSPGPARMEERSGKSGVVTSAGEWLPLEHPRVRLAIPSMNPHGAVLAAAALTGAGVNALALPPADEAAMKLGRGNSSCKECLPLQLTVGTLLGHLESRPPDEVTAYFMPGADGPCRFGQYAEYSGRLIRRLAIPDAAVLSPNAANGYTGLSASRTLAVWRGIVAGDLFEEMRSALLACAADPEDALAALRSCLVRAEAALRLPWKAALGEMRIMAEELSRLPLRRNPEGMPVVSLAGEIYVRHDPISRQRLVRGLAARGFVVRTAPVAEWVYYTDWLQNKGITRSGGLRGRLRQWFKRLSHHQARRAFMPSGLLGGHAPDVGEVMRLGSRHISPLLTGEAVLTVGSAFREILDPSCGIVCIGPFGCMPTRLAEAVLSKTFDAKTLEAHAPGKAGRLGGAVEGRLPLLCVETDGNPFPQLIEARIDAFCLQAARLHEALKGRA
ncbi:MAG: BadF/BadG/BcrA/BcrD ATPase family protein [Thermodesulfobacteriota bacterium]